MTKPIPKDGERKRPARVCTSCRTAKVRCLGAEAPDDVEDCFATIPCARCKTNGNACQFVKSRRMGRPRRLPKVGDTAAGVEVEEDGEDVRMGMDRRGSGGGSTDASLSPSFSLSPSSWTEASSFYATPETSASPSSSSSTQSAALAKRYLLEIHPWFPLLPPSLSFITSYLENGLASINLTFALTTLLSSPTPIPITFSGIQLNRTIYDTQAAMILFYYLYGMAEPEKARPFINWIYETIKVRGWNGTSAETGIEREMCRRLWWEASFCEILYSVTSGVRDLKISQLNPTTVVSEEDISLFGQTTFPCKVRALSLLRDVMDPSITPSSQDYAVVISIGQKLIAECEQLFAASCYGLDVSSLSIEEQAIVQAADEQVFVARMMSSTALVNILCSSSSLASSGFMCGIDSTAVLTKGFPLVTYVDPISQGAHIVSAKEIIRGTCESLFNFLKGALATPFAGRPHSSFYGCVLMMATTGLINAGQNYMNEGTVPPTIAEIRVGSSQAIMQANVDLAQAILKDQSRRWPITAMIAAGVELMQVAWITSYNTVTAAQQARDLVTSF